MKYCIIFIFLLLSCIVFNSCILLSPVGISESIKQYEKYYNIMADSSKHYTYNYDTAFTSIQTLKQRYSQKPYNSINNIHNYADSATYTKDSSSNVLHGSINNIHNSIKGKLDSADKVISEVFDSTASYSDTASKILEIKTQITAINDTYFPDSIIINAIVFDNDGNFISGLASPYLENNQNYKDYWKYVIDSCKGKANKINELHVEEIREATSPPYSICYVLDHSPSMGNERTLNLQQSVRYAIGKVKDGDLLSAIKFTNKATVEVPPTDDKEVFKSQFKLNGMATSKYGAGTHILLALDSAAETLKKNPEEYKRIIILFTDGASSTANYHNIVKKLKQYKIRVFPICYGMTDFEFMENLARDTDGKVFLLRTIKDFPKVFQYIYNTLSNYYKISYKPPVCADLHNVTLNISLPEFGFENIQDSGQYDKSLFNNYVEVGTVTLMDIEFEYNKSTISPSSLSMLKDIANQLQRNGQVKIEICGHTDDKGSDEYNMKLSLERAKSIKNELIQLGIDEKRLTTKGYGKSKPIAPNDTEENRKKNRRTEFIVVQ